MNYHGLDIEAQKGGYEDEERTILHIPVLMESPSGEYISIEAEYEQEDFGEIDYIKVSKHGVCDFPMCQEETFMRCDYDLNDLIDPDLKRPQLVLTCLWRGIRGCGRQFCIYHAGKQV